jgi:signal transduction histidine kinase
MDDEARALAQLRERETIAMDLHDGLVQDMYGVALVLASAEQGDPSGEAAVNAMRQARAEIDSIIDETRRYLMDLRARELLPRNLAAGLRLLVDTLRINAKLDVELRLDLTADARLEPEARGHLLYVAREAVSNVLRHAQASSVVVALSLDDDRVLLSVTDDGRGFDPSVSTDEKRRHYGLRNMRTRARMIGAHLAVASRPGKGTRVMLELPLAG